MRTSRNGSEGAASASTSTATTAAPGEVNQAPQRQKRKPGRTPTACAECRRLKLRCSRQVPCEKCESRGCASICPNGVLIPGKGNKLILANTEELHDRIDHLSLRIKELEGALCELQSSVSDKPHPLLRLARGSLAELLQSSGLGRSEEEGEGEEGKEGREQQEGEFGEFAREVVGMEVEVERNAEGGVNEEGMHLDQSSQTLKPEIGQPWSTSTATTPSVVIPRSVNVPQPVLTDEEIRGIDLLGTLISDVDGSYTHIGYTARPEFLIGHTQSPLRHRQHPHGSSHPTPFVVRLSKRILAPTNFLFDSSLPFPSPHAHFPSGAANDEDVYAYMHNLGNELYQHLPSPTLARELCETYIEHGAYLYTSLTADELVEEVFLAVYRAGSFKAILSRDALALLFSVFALGSLMSSQLKYQQHQQPGDSSVIQAEEYFYLSRAALSLAVTNPTSDIGGSSGVTLGMIQTVIHLAQYLDLCDHMPMVERLNLVWSYVGYAVRLGYEAGLQLHSVHWNLPPEPSRRRLRMFWQLFALETWASFYYGRPPSMSTSFIDCPFPKDIPSQNATMSFDLWTWKFTSLLHTITTLVFAPPKRSQDRAPYGTIIELDKRVRDFCVPSQWRMRCASHTGTASSGMCVAVVEGEGEEVVSRECRLQRWFVLGMKEIVLLNLHRPYLLQALYDNPREWTRHQYRASIVACYRSSWRLIHGLRMTYEQDELKEVLCRLGLPWSQCFSAIVVLALITVRIPICTLGSQAVQVLDVGVGLVEQGVVGGCEAAANILETAQKLRARARESIKSRVTHVYFDQQDAGLELLERLVGRTSHVCERGRENTAAPATHAGAATPGGPATTATTVNTAWKTPQFTFGDAEDPFELLTARQLRLQPQQQDQQKQQKQQQQSLSMRGEGPQRHEHPVVLHAVLEQNLRELWMRKPLCMDNGSFFDLPSGQTTGHSGDSIGITPTEMNSGAAHVEGGIGGGSGGGINSSIGSEPSQPDTHRDTQAQPTQSQLQAYHERVFITTVVGSGLGVPHYYGAGGTMNTLGDYNHHHPPRLHQPSPSHHPHHYHHHYHASPPPQPIPTPFAHPHLSPHHHPYPSHHPHPTHHHQTTIQTVQSCWGFGGSAGNGGSPVSGNNPSPSGSNGGGGPGAGNASGIGFGTSAAMGGLAGLGSVGIFASAGAGAGTGVENIGYSSLAGFGGASGQGAVALDPSMVSLAEQLGFSTQSVLL
ncbi:hypothetical protein AMATHDRAFT_67507 [Amanita thiersii Skay4041]|uniref:Zn(2)-C6 fungal-type domain-containing protein n=1 Tax=Amanita thiersii Skay4041 TaxID=703135 RepID=A0A2A9NAD1_9AGAR|nr:hypothetical protein AMATHDRAFT_67507 [Amanita thiersii Skay4041]